MSETLGEIRVTLESIVLGWPRVMAGSVFGSPGYYVKGHACAFWVGEGLVLKLPEAARPPALERPGARRYTVPRGSGPEWVLVPVEPAGGSNELIDLFRRAYQFAGGDALPPESRSN